MLWASASVIHSVSPDLLVRKSYNRSLYSNISCYTYKDKKRSSVFIIIEHIHYIKIYSIIIYNKWL